MTTHDEDFVAFVDASMRDLRRTAYLLCGDWQHAEDAVQTALVKVYLKWRKLDRTNSVWGYARRCVVTAVIDDSRRVHRAREATFAELPDSPALGYGGADEMGSVDDRLLLQQALDALPRRQRAVVVLRYVDDLDVRETAFVLRLAEGTVTSSGARALAFLRKFLLERGFVRSRHPEMETVHTV